MACRPAAPAPAVNLQLDTDQIARCIREIGVGFLFAQQHHSAMRHAAPVRQELGVRTIMNVLGPLTNPAGARRQVIGVFSPRWLEPLAQVLDLLGAEHVLLVHSDGLDEIRLAAPTQVVELHHGTISHYSLTPERFGMSDHNERGLEATSVEDSLALVKQSLKEPDSAAASIVALNAGAAIYVAGVARSLEDGVTMAQDAIAAGLAQERFDELARVTRMMAAP